MHPYELALQLIRHFGKTLGLEDLTLEVGTHGCALEFDSDIVVTFEFHEASERIVLTSLVGVMPQINAEPILRALAMANFASYLDGAITLGLEPHPGPLQHWHVHGCRQQVLIPFLNDFRLL